MYSDSGNHNHFKETHLFLQDKTLESFNVRGLFTIQRSTGCAYINVDEYYNRTTYKLRRCIPDPQGQATAVMVVANTVGDVVITTFNDTSCTSKLGRKHLNHTLVGTCIGPDASYGAKEFPCTLYQIRQQWTSEQMGIVKKYYFDETCTGPHSKAYTANWVCFRDPYTGQSMKLSDYFHYSTEYSINEYRGSNDCTGWQESLEAQQIPGYQECVQEGNHFVYTLLGGTQWHPTSQPTGQPSYRPPSR
jgi:hypothetical protein